MSVWVVQRQLDSRAVLRDTIYVLINREVVKLGSALGLTFDCCELEEPQKTNWTNL